MSYIVPRNKPDRCTNCPFMDRITYDCMLMYGNDYSDFEAQYNHCPLVEVNEPLFSADNAREFLRENPSKEGETDGR